MSELQINLCVYVRVFNVIMPGTAEPSESAIVYCKQKLKENHVKTILFVNILGMSISYRNFNILSPVSFLPN